jgi:hypothetical protein
MATVVGATHVEGALAFASSAVTTRSSCGDAAGGGAPTSEVRRNWHSEHEGEVLCAPGKSLVAETHRGGTTPVRVEGRAAQRGSTVAEALRWAPVALRQSYDAKME